MYTHGEMANIYTISVGVHRRKGPFGRPRCRRNVNIKMDLAGIIYKIKGKAIPITDRGDL
jgi:hypothetical protein